MNIMEEIFNEKNYRNYLENYYYHTIDKDNPNRKKYIDKYSKEELQKIIDETKIFSDFVVQELRKEKDNLIDSVFMEVELIDEKRISTNLTGGWAPDILYNPNGFGEDFWFSKHILEQYLQVKIDIIFKYVEYYNPEEGAGVIIDTPCIFIRMEKEQFEVFDKDVIFDRSGTDNVRKRLR